MCKLFGKSRQAYYQLKKQIHKEQIDSEMVIELVKKARKNKPRTGGRKLYIELKDMFNRHNINIGRDKFFDILRASGMLIKKRKRRVYTTQSFHWLRKYPNTAAGFEPQKTGELWVSDITYIEIGAGFAYLYLITDAYSHKIVGWYLSESLHAKNAVIALKSAFANEQTDEGLIHHSDRGVQYCSQEYVKILNKHHCRISMTESGDPRENAIAERVNGILKDEWINDLNFETIARAKAAIKKIIEAYNTERLHMSIDFQTPEQAHLMRGKIEKKWKTYAKKYNKEKVIELCHSF